MTVGAAPSKTNSTAYVVSVEMVVDSEQEAPTWASVLGGMNCWRFMRTALDVRLTLEQLVETVTKETGEEPLRMKAENRLEGFSLALFDPEIGNEAKELLIELMKSLDGVVLSKVRLASALVKVNWLMWLATAARMRTLAAGLLF
jgi:hypothetical protein